MEILKTSCLCNKIICRPSQSRETIPLTLRLNLAKICNFSKNDRYRYREALSILKRWFLQKICCFVNAVLCFLCTLPVFLEFLAKGSPTKIYDTYQLIVLAGAILLKGSSTVKLTLSEPAGVNWGATVGLGCLHILPLRLQGLHTPRT